MPKQKTSQLRWDRWSLRLPDKEDQEKVIALYKKTGAHTKSEFMRKKMLNETFYLQTADVHLLQFLDSLEAYLVQIHKIGTNYNQAVKVLNAPHSPLQGGAMTENLIKLSQKIMENQGEVMKLCQQLKLLCVQK